MPRDLSESLQTASPLEGRECAICAKPRGDSKQMDRHHTNYERDEWIPLCQECHARVHDEEGFYDQLAPPETRHW
jgi:hypothetical protein